MKGLVGEGGRITRFGGGRNQACRGCFPHGCKLGSSKFLDVLKRDRACPEVPTPPGPLPLAITHPLFNLGISGPNYCMWSSLFRGSGWMGGC